MSQPVLNAAVQSGAFFTGMCAGHYITEPLVHKLAVGAIAALSGANTEQIEADYHTYEKQFAVAKTAKEMTAARQAFENKYGKYTLTAHNLSSIASTVFSVISSAALARHLSPSAVGLTLAGMTGIGAVSILATLLTLPAVRSLAVKVLEALTGEELGSDFDRYTKEAVKEDKLVAAQEFKEKHGSYVFGAFRTSERVTAVATTFAVSLLAQYAFIKQGT